MNYRHAFHAGNHADVLKHALLAMILARLCAKAKPLVVIDAFAGGGTTDLELDDRAARTGEWRRGVARLWPLGEGHIRERAPDAPGEDGDAAVDEALAPYLAALSRSNPTGALRYAPGSPAIIQGALRPEDKLLAVEKQPDEAAALRRSLGADRRVRLYERDGWEALRSFLPPTPRRGLVLIDPPFEAPGDYERLARALQEGLRRWATGVFLLWHPVKDRRRVAEYERALVDAAGATPLLLCELSVAPDGAGGLLGSGLAIANPPFGLEEQAQAMGRRLAARLADPGAAGWRMTRLTEAR